MERVAPWLKAVNTVLTPAIAGRRKKIDRILDRAVREAEHRTGSTARGDESFVEDMRLVLAAYADVPDLTPAGWVGTQAEVTDRIASRLRVRKRHVIDPELADERIDRPIVVTGLPRTGTTFLHRLLAAADGLRGPLLRELLHADLPDAPADDHRRRTERMVDTVHRFIPTFGEVYDLDGEKPDTDTWVLPHGIGHLVRVHPPGYAQWMLERDYTADYRYLKQTLQVLQHGRPGRRWVLKAPAHLWSLGALLRAFPDAQIVWTHRDPGAAVASLSSMTETAMNLSTGDPDPHAIGAMWLELAAVGIDRARAERERLLGEPIIDVAHRDLNDDAPVRLPALFERLGVPWGPAETANLEAALAARPTGHRYHLARYGISGRDVQHAFADYLRYYGGLC